MALRHAQVGMQPLLILAVAEPLLILAEQSPLAAVPPAPGSHSRCGWARPGFRRTLASPAGLPLSSRFPTHAWASPQLFTQL